jgi:hypothetical protein
MSISFSCHQCSTALSAPEEYAGRTVKCRTCGAHMRVPNELPGTRPPPVPDGSGAPDREPDPEGRHTPPFGADAHLNECPLCHAAAPTGAAFCMSCGYGFRGPRLQAKPGRAGYDRYGRTVPGANGVPPYRAVRFVVMTIEVTGLVCAGIGVLIVVAGLVGAVLAVVSRSAVGTLVGVGLGIDLIPPGLLVFLVGVCEIGWAQLIAAIRDIAINSYLTVEREPGR